MRHFHSYGPVDCRLHFCVERRGLIDRCVDYLVGDLDAGGHYFTIWAPRQTGKTWLMRQAIKEIERKHEDRFVVGAMSMQGLIMEEDDPDEVFFRHVPRLFRDSLGVKTAVPAIWDDWTDLFAREEGVFRKPLILFIDEFDSLPARILDRLITLFRDMYLKPESYLLHGLALIGVRAVLGVDSERGSPFNIQRSLHVPNLYPSEVQDLFLQYQEESGQAVDPAVVTRVYDVTRGQPGLVSWFGELLTEKYNPGIDQVIGMDTWDLTYMKALYVEWNNTVLNLVKKARGRYLSYVLNLFTRSDIPFTLRADWCNYLYLNGIIDNETGVDQYGTRTEVCRFSCPFVQQSIYDALAYELVGDHTPILALDPIDDLADVFHGPSVDVPGLLRRYKDYLQRLKSKGMNPWKEQPRRSDLHITEAVGHFHLYAWLREAVGRRCVVSPEFPTGNGKVDLHLICGESRGIIEVKSFVDASQVKEAGHQAARYAAGLGLDKVTVALFLPIEDKEVIEKFSGEEVIKGVKVAVVAIGWT
jgi:hypothetical protein